MLDVFTFTGSASGPTVLFLGAVHGREVCGTRALTRLKQAFESGALHLQAGKLVVVPVCNPQAQAADERLIDENLNRIIARYPTPQTYEQHLANVLVPLLDGCNVLVDLHSTTTAGVPFCFMDLPNPATRTLVQLMQVPYIVTGWPEMYAKEALDGDSTDTYVGKQGKAATCLECGQHVAPESEQVAYESCLNVLRHYGLVAGEVVSTGAKTLRVKAFWRREHAEDAITQDWRNFTPVHKGDVLLKRASGQEVCAPADGYVIFCPNYQKLGSEMLYFGGNDDA